MIDILTLKERTVEVKSLIPEIKFTDFVASDDELVHSLMNLKKSDNIMLVSVVPSYSGFGIEDSSGFRTYLNFYILEKTDDKQLRNRDEYMAVFQRTLAAARRFIAEVFSIEGQLCISSELEYSSLMLRPVINKAQCYGWMLEIDEKKYEDF